MKKDKPRVIIRGGGEMASGAAHRLFACGFRPIILELPEPLLIRRTVCFGEAVYSDEWIVEGVISRLVSSPPEHDEDYIPVIVDREGEMVRIFKPHILIDGRMLKKKADISVSDAPLVIGLGPEIEAGKDAHLVIETQRGQFIGRIYKAGKAISDTGIPGEIAGKTEDRLLRAPGEGVFENLARIGNRVSKGDAVARAGAAAVKARLDGIVRGLLKNGLYVRLGQKVGDIDPRVDIDVHAISDKARSVGNAVLGAIFSSMEWHMELPPWKDS